MTDRRKVKILLKIWLSLGAIALVGGYAAFRAKDMVSGPAITVTSPANGTLVSDSLVEIKGTAEHVSFLTLNGDKIYTDESGVFSEKILLSYGYNSVTLGAKDRFGRTVTKNLQLIYK